MDHRVIGVGIAALVMILAVVISTAIKRRDQRQQALRNRLAKSQLDHEAGER